MIFSFLQYSIRLSAVFLFGCVGEIITEKSGHLNLGIPGIMCAGTAGGCLGIGIYMASIPDPSSPSYLLLVLIALTCAFIFAAFMGGIYSFLTVSLKCNQNISGLALTTFGIGFTSFLMDNYVKKDYFDVASTYIAKSFSFSESLGWFGKLFFSYGIFVYLAIVIAVITAFCLKRTKIGLRLRATGENPAAADAVGINVTEYKYLAILIGSGIAGLGGVFFVMDIAQGSFENSAVIEEYGWLSIALVIFTLWRPNLAIFGSILFGSLYSLPYFIANKSATDAALIGMVPYVVAAIVLILISITGSKNVQPPASLGLNYFREDR